MKRHSQAFAAVALLVAVAGAAGVFRFRLQARLRVSAEPSPVLADGRVHRVLQLNATHGRTVLAEDVQVTGTLTPATIDSASGHGLLVSQRAPVMAGSEPMRLTWHGRPTSTKVIFAPDTAASAAAPALPDWMPLHEAADRAAFRRWFTTLADRSASAANADLPAEISDCAALLRYSFRESLRRHDDRWSSDAPELERVSLPSVAQWTYPDTPLHAGLFRTRPGAYLPADDADGTFTQFADAKTLVAANTFRVGRDLRSARPGDLLFYRLLQLDAHHQQQFHSMIVTGAHAEWAVYHTGPITAANGVQGKGEIRRVLLRDLLEHPDPRWRPLATNGNFLGVYRWNLLAEEP